MKFSPGQRIRVLRGSLTGRWGTVRRLCDLDFSAWCQLDQPITEEDGVDRFFLDFDHGGEDNIEPLVRLWPMDVVQ